MNPVVEDAIFEAIHDEEKTPVPVLGNIFAEQYNSLARAVIDCREILTLGLYPVIMKSVIGKACSWLAFACENPSRRKRVPVDVQKTVDVWIPLILKLAVAHDIDEKDAASSAMDEALLPIIAAPVAQVREFYKNLTQRLKSNPEIPWAVWKLFEFWGENVLDKINQEEVAGLKKEIALRIAQRSDAAIPREEWILAMVGALQWRSPEKLQEIEAALDAGQKPSIKGKESCLFLQVGEAEVML
jgi:hypothetical protein